MSTPSLSPLGKAVAYAAEYDPALLFPIPRADKRAEIGVPEPLPFFGLDLWNAYELSWLNARGKPQVALAEFAFPADSPNIVESKSFKLYLNSFNQTRLATPEELALRLRRDLSAACGGAVTVRLLGPERFADCRLGEPDGYCIDGLDIDVDRYEPDPGLLRSEADAAPVEERLVSHLLKSNCLVTGQPDWASVRIHYVGPPIVHEGLLRYLISFRNHNEFHEQCVERIFMDIQRRCRPLKLSVYARYTRRGGLDINPWRSNFETQPPLNLRGARQ